MEDNQASEGTLRSTERDKLNLKIGSGPSQKEHGGVSPKGGSAVNLQDFGQEQ